MGYAKYCLDPKKQQWWSVDKTGHGESAWKVYDEFGGWLADTDIYGDHMNKYKSEVGKSISLKSLKCGDEK